MTKQDKKIYSSLVNRIAFVLLVNQGLVAIFSALLGFAEKHLVAMCGNIGTVADIALRMGECVAYFVSFVLPVHIFNKMNKNAPREIYEPIDNEKATPLQTFFYIGMGLGATTLAAYVNYYAVNIFIDYSEFTQENFWSVELDNVLQMVIYFIYVAIIPAVVEELLFRATVCRSLTVYGKGTAVLISAFLFALMHANVEQLLYTFVAGLMLGWIYVETKSLVFPVLLHFINNGMSALGEIIYQSCSQTEYNIYSSYSDMIVWIFSFVSLAAFLLQILKKGSFITKIKMKPDENGEEVLPLSTSDKLSGFFGVGMIMFVTYSVFTMVYYIYLSLQK